MIDRNTPLPNGFSTGPTYTNYLRVYYLPDNPQIDAHTGWYYIFDQWGYLCRTNQVGELHQLFEWQSTRPTYDNPFPVGARATLDPEWAQGVRDRLAQANNAIPPKPGSIGAPGSRPEPKTKQKLNLSLGDLGL